MARKAAPTGKDEGERVRIDFRVSPAEHDAFIAAAAKLGLPLAAWLRMIARERSSVKGPRK